MFNNDWVTRANFKAVRFNAATQKDLNTFLITYFDIRLQIDTITSPKVIQVPLADPLLACFSVVLVLGLEKDALVMPNVRLELIVADHSVTEKTKLMPCLLLLVIHKLVGKVCSPFSFYNFGRFSMFLDIILMLNVMLYRTCL